MNRPIETEELIELVRARPTLYNKKLKSYLNINQKKKMWLEICQTLFPEWPHLSSGEKACIGERVQKRWQNIRSCFKREYNLQLKTASDPTPRRRKIYEYYDSLHFLIPQMGNFEVEDDEVESEKEDGKEESDEAQDEYDDDNEKVFLETQNSDSEHNDPVDVKHEVDETEKDDSMTTRTTQAIDYNEYKARKLLKARRSKKREAVFVDNQYQFESSSTRLDSIKALNTSNSDPLDEDTHFLLSLVPSFQRMTYSQKLKVKMKFLHILREMAEKLEF